MWAAQRIEAASLKEAASNKGLKKSPEKCEYNEFKQIR